MTWSGPAERHDGWLGSWLGRDPREQKRVALCCAVPPRRRKPRGRRVRVGLLPLRCVALRRCFSSLSPASTDAERTERVPADLTDYGTQVHTGYDGSAPVRIETSRCFVCCELRTTRCCCAGWTYTYRGAPSGGISVRDGHARWTAGATPEHAHLGSRILGWHYRWVGTQSRLCSAGVRGARPISVASIFLPCHGWASHQPPPVRTALPSLTPSLSSSHSPIFPNLKSFHFGCIYSWISSPLVQKGTLTHPMLCIGLGGRWSRGRC